MLDTPKVHPDSSKCIWVLYDLRGCADRESLCRTRTLLQADSDQELLGPDHVVLKIFPGGALRVPS